VSVRGRLQHWAIQMVDVLVRDQHDVGLLGKAGSGQGRLPRTVVARCEERIAEDVRATCRVAQSEAGLAEPPQFNRQLAQSIAVAIAGLPGSPRPPDHPG
jgi:hypothetical protein